MHSEKNKGGNTLRFLQVWIQPDKSGYRPNYGQALFTRKNRHNRLLQILSGNKKFRGGVIPEEETIRLNQDVNIYVSEADPDYELNYTLEAGRQAYVVCIEGRLCSFFRAYRALTF